MRRMILPLLYVSNFSAQSAHTETDRRFRVVGSCAGRGPGDGQINQFGALLVPGE